MHLLSDYEAHIMCVYISRMVFLFVGNCQFTRTCCKMQAFDSLLIFEKNSFGENTHIWTFPTCSEELEEVILQVGAFILSLMQG